MRIHTSEVQAEVHHLEAFLHKLPHHVGRSYWSTVRCRPEEHAAIREKARAVGMSEAGFIRAVVFGWPMGRGDHREAVIQLRRFENNLRQLQNWWTGDGVTAARVYRLREQIRARVRELTSKEEP